MVQAVKSLETIARGPDAEPESMEATINYIVADGTKIFRETGAPGANDRRSGGKPDPRRVILHNGRHRKFSLERDGFLFISHDTKVGDFFDETEVRRIYYPEMEALVKAESGAKRVVVFDHTLRTANDAVREARKIREVLPRVHNDYTESSGPKRLRDSLPDEADDLLRRRFAIVQVWRPIRYAVETFPLAICDARTLSPGNLIVSEWRSPDYVGQTYAITYSPDHVWYWFPQMRREEALVFKTYESLTDGRARWAAHTAFHDPTAAPNARLRESIEIRTLVFF
jgi:hypothetical protein